MKTDSKKWKLLLYVLTVLMCMSTMPMTVIAADKSNVASSSSSDSNPAADDKKQEKNEKLNAGAAVLLDVDISMKDEEIVELVKSKTTETIEIKTLEKTESDLVMAKVNQYVNIRENPDQESEKLGVLYKDCGGYILEQQNEWTKIRSGDVTGWIKNDYLYFGEEAENLAKEVGMLTATAQTETLRVRKESSLEAEVLGLLAMDETMEAIAEEGDWVSVSYEGTTGYVSAQYVKVDFQIDVAESIVEIKEREAREAEAKRNAQKEAIMTSASEMDILAALIQCEAGGESYEGQLAVGAVVMNRVRSGAYPSSIPEVIYASGQFSPASSGRMSSLILTGNIKESCRQAAQQAVSGACNVGDATHFRRVGNKEGLIIGNHVFW